ncbi:MAG: hypothetical protein OXQ94_13760 [Gemmatimonadota bacterium]|nr:hypothetical protein [Gemmatimonadota bacterium]MDE2872741.1 hypothetical protein [Gemmatimonadota bacterium]
MIVAIRVRQSPPDGEYESVRLAEVATIGEVFAELTAAARHYTNVRQERHRATAWTSCGRVLATVSMSPQVRTQTAGMARQKRV